MWQMLAGAMTGNTQLIVGSGVNLILAIAVMTSGIWSGSTVAMVSPVFARFLGIGPPFWVIIPFIMVGNLAFVIIWHKMGNAKIGSKPIFAYVIAAFCAALAKYLILFFGIVHVAIPMFLEVAPPQAAAIATVFGVPQFITAAIGGGIACVMLPLLRNALSKGKE